MQELCAIILFIGRCLNGVAEVTQVVFRVVMPQDLNPGSLTQGSALE